MATNFADPITLAWPNWAKIFFNNKGVAATETDDCADYPPDDQSLWDASVQKVGAIPVAESPDKENYT
jgi:hypothetical protein